MQIGSHQLSNNLILAPMAGVTDGPFRSLCHAYGAGLTVSEMVISHADLQQHPRTLKKTDDQFFSGLRSVQILGTDPSLMADAARFNRQRGADIIDINMGCPAKKVCSVAAGSALMRDETLVGQILTAVVNAVDVPVTLKIRTGWDLQSRNAVAIAKIAEASGIQALAVHGRSRACKFNGSAEYETIRQVKDAIAIPVIANGDITSAEKAQTVMAYTGVDAVMIGRAAQGRPWLFAELAAKLQGKSYNRPSLIEINAVVMQHLDNLYSFYGNVAGVRIARKHIVWYFDHLGGLSVVRKTAIHQAESPAEQSALVDLAFQEVNPSFAFGN